MSNTRRACVAVVGSAVLVSLLAACGTAAPKIESTSGNAMGHIHGLGTDPTDGTLFVASHLGLFTVEEGSPPRRVGEAWHDFMGFSVIGPGHFVASGHPDLASDLPKHLGLMESIDAGKTWRQVSLAGKADFHALDGTDSRLAGYNSVSGQLLVTRDRTNWTTIDERPVIDVATDPDSTDLFATTPSGELIRYPASDGARARTVVAPSLAYIDGGQDGLVVGIAATGRVHVSRDGGESWRAGGALPDSPEALEVTPDRWYAAAGGAVFESTTSGATWSRLT